MVPSRKEWEVHSRRVEETLLLVEEEFTYPGILLMEKESVRLINRQLERGSSEGLLQSTAL